MFDENEGQGERRGGHGRGGGRGGRRRGGRGGHGGGGGHRRRGAPRQSSESGNQRERIAVESGHLVLIDQFMLANQQFLERLERVAESEADAKNDVVEDFGGTVLELSPGTYRINRDPFSALIVIHPDGEEVDVAATSASAQDEGVRVFVDTRCLAMVDRELLDDRELLNKYKDLWLSGQEKACRDLLRDNGGAVRYGFSRFSDDLAVKRVNEGDVVCLTPVQAPVEAAASAS